jgi:hypothetical protein
MPNLHEIADIISLNLSRMGVILEKSKDIYVPIKDVVYVRSQTKYKFFTERTSSEIALEFVDQILAKKPKKLLFFILPENKKFESNIASNNHVSIRETIGACFGMNVKMACLEMCFRILS